MHLKVYSKNLCMTLKRNFKNTLNLWIRIQNKLKKLKKILKEFKK